MKHSKWFYVRIVIVGIGSLSGLLSSLPGSSDSQYIDILDCIIVLILCPLGLLFIIGIQAINPYSEKVWIKPSWESNPFNLKDPLHFFHLAAFHIMAGTIGSLISLIFQGTKLWLPILFYICAGASTWLGVQLCQFAYKKKYSIG